MDKAPDAFRTISEVAEELDVPQHVLRFWESRFAQIRPMKRGGGRRYYRPADVTLLKGIRHLLYGEGYTIRGVQKLFREEGAGFVAGFGDGRPPLSAGADEDGPAPPPLLKRKAGTAPAANADDAGPAPKAPARAPAGRGEDTLRAAIEDALDELEAVRALLARTGRR